MRILAMLKAFSSLDMKSKKEYKIGNEWSIMLPEIWEEEKKGENGYYVFHSKDGLIFEIVNHCIFRGQEPVPAEMLSNMLNGTIAKLRKPKENKMTEKELKNSLGNEFIVKCYDDKNGKTHRTLCAIITDGYMLEISIYSEYRMDIENALKYIYTVKKTKDLRQ